MKRFARLTLWSGLVFVLAVGASPAQQVAEILRGALNGVSTDLFNCGAGTTPCDLSYRIYSKAANFEINGPANPVDGIPQYLAADQRYRTDAVTTLNYPAASAAGFGNEWFVAWDGITGAGTTAHAGWYGAQSQLVNFGELGNSAKFNCLPITSQEACFGALDASVSNDTVRADASALVHDGGISPIPCPTLTDNGLTSLTYAWELPSNWVTRDGAGRAVRRADLYLSPDPVAALTDGDLAATAVRVASVAYPQTSVTVDRANINLTPGLEGSSAYSAAIKLRYRGGLKDSIHFSCNSALSALAQLPAGETGDAPAAADVTQIFTENRTGSNHLVISMKFAETVVIKPTIRIKVKLAAGLNQGTIEIRDRERKGGQIVLRFRNDFGDVDLVGLSTLDNDNGLITLVVNADNLAAFLGSNTATLSGRVEVSDPQSARDDFNAGVISF